jgi:Animal haem peroxidase
MTRLEKAPGKLLRDMRHGGQVVADDAPQAKELSAIRERISLLSSVLPGDGTEQATTPFSYLFEDLAAQFPARHLPGDPAQVTAALETLGVALAETPAPNGNPAGQVGNSTIPPVYTYWGQFIDHDITANTDRQNSVTDLTIQPVQPVPPEQVREQLRNLRQPALNLDSVYADGPGMDGGPATGLYDGPALRVGEVAQVNDDGGPIRGDHVTPAGDERHDLPRNGTVAVLGDARNDENLIVAQFHVAFLRFHNAVLDWVRAQPPGDGYQPDDDMALFTRARDLVRWHYQWLVVHDYLKTVTLPGTADKVLLGGNRLFAPRDGDVYMPLEFSVAAYRFGHSMVRAAYDYNRNFGRPGVVIPTAPFSLIFNFTGSGRPQPFGGRTTVLPFNWVIEWDRFTDKGDSQPDHFARKIDTQLAPPLFDMINQITPAEQALPAPVQDILKRLAVRNLLRGYQLALPTGQAVAAALGVAPLTEAELLQGNSAEVNGALTGGGFIQDTPLWYYLLKEAEVRANGNSLGEAGSRIVAETLIGQLRYDPDSYLNVAGGWNPAQGVLLPGGDPIVTIKDLFRFAGVLP